MTISKLVQYRSGKTLYLQLHGGWELEQLPHIRSLLNSVPVGMTSLVVDARKIEQLDVSIAWLLHQQIILWEHQGKIVSVEGFPEEYTHYFETELSEISTKKTSLSWSEPISVIGKKLIFSLQAFYSAIAFLGHSLARLPKSLISPNKLHLSSVLYHVFNTGINSILIVAMVACLMSIVITYQGGGQLQELGATIYTVDMVAISVLRELGALLTAIVVAGRSGSAFAAEIGLMKTNQEVDALKVMGCDPFVVLVLPRMLALLIALPLLTLIADILALVAAAWISPFLLDISFGQFFARVEHSIGLSTFLAGLIKAPFFAIVIAWVGCWQGMQVSGSSESLGKHTTKAVVQSILLVLLLDALFSILFYKLGF